VLDSYKLQNMTAYMENSHTEYELLISIETLKNLDIDSALCHLESLIDLSLDLQKIEGLEKSIELSEELFGSNLNKKDLCILHYFIGNAWDALKNLKFNENNKNIQWENEEIENEIIHLRMALTGEGFSDLNDGRKCQILTNLGNLMDEIGRFVEAIEYWERALKIDNSFAMAIGNRGEGIANYACTLYDRRQSIVLFNYARSNLEIALASQLHQTAKAHFEKYIEWIDSKNLQDCIDCIKKDTDLNKFPVGDSEEEIMYRKWCLENRLFLNPLNDLGQFNIASTDIISTPSITYKINEGPYYSGYFNQLKQEYVSARYLYYEGINSKEVHFSDKDVYLVNTLDYPAHSIATEKVKIAFRINYSIFDKISYFLNDYLKLSIPTKAVYFKTLWYESQKKKNGLRKEFENNHNWPMRGLFWISKDLFENKSSFMQAMEPDAQQLYEIRNHIEHKYFKLHNEILFGPEDLESSGLTDPLAFSMLRQEFEEKTLRLIKTIRASLIYLSTAIHYEEKRRSKLNPRNVPCPQFQTSEFDEEWKT